MGVHIIILYASEGEIVAEVKASAAESGRICSRGCKEKHPTMLKIATDDAKISCRNAVASYICIANCAILFALDVVLRRPETSATFVAPIVAFCHRAPNAVQSDCVRRPIRFRPPSDQIPFAVRSDFVRNPIRFRPPSDWTSYAIPLSSGGLRPPQHHVECK